MDPLKLDVLFAGKRILFTGATGFLGKVTLCLLLERYPEIGQILIVARRAGKGSAEERVFGEVLTSEPFRPLRERYGGGVNSFFREKIRVVDGDVTDPNLGILDLGELGKVDLLLSCAGLVTFDPSLEQAIDVNTLGARNTAQLAVALAAPLVHVSTCFVAGERSGPIFEDEPILGEYPRRKELEGLPLDPDAEIRDCQRLCERVKATVDDLSIAALFRKAAVERLREEGRSETDERALRMAIARERKLHLAKELIRVGMERARHWGWPNTYTFTKALAEQVIVQAGDKSGLRYAIVRPSIVESALRFPFPGWNEGFTTSAPLAFMGLKGHKALPVGERNILDMIPVDLVAGATIGIAGATLSGRNRSVYQLASGDVNPFYAARAVELVGLYRRRVYRRRIREDEGGKLLDKWTNTLSSRTEMRPISRERYDLTSVPMFKRLATGGRNLIANARPKWGAPQLQAALSQLDTSLADIEKQSGQLANLIELFVPFLCDNAYIFRCDHTRELFQQLGEGDQERLRWDPEKLDWREYFLDVHMAGMEAWVFPGLEEERDRSRRRVRAHKDLVELFKATTEKHATRVALRYLDGTRRRIVTYARLRMLAERAAGFLAEQGVRAGDRILLCGENRPEWPICYFGILLAGGVAVPIDAECSPEELANLRGSSQARAVVLSAKVAERTELEGDGCFTFDEVLAPRAAEPLPPLAIDAETPASLIFTSGTTGKPKGVLLSHRNFAQLCAKLQSTFDLREGEGVLSVLPLHHTFEFSCGLLTPLAIGAEITYLDELTADRLSDALTSERIHALVGVPALFQLLHRKLTRELAARPKVVERAVELLTATNRELRDRLGINAGKLLFWPVHRGFGGRLKMLVSGGSALSEDVHDAFRGLGFDLTEGYGLTEAAPVLAVTPVGEKRKKGSVGRPLPGIELRIDSPDATGIGEVLARGPNVMLGYFQNEEATAEVLQDGWLRTGDLGTLDSDGYLHLVGRKKDVILDASGKNIYPDELEDHYRQDAPADLEDLSVVGLPDGQAGETIACLVQMKEGNEDSLDARMRLEDHFRKVSATLPFTRRIKILHFTTEKLPRTATRKVKRPEVVVELSRREAVREPGGQGTKAVAPGATLLVVIEKVGLVARRRSKEIGPATRLVHELGLDSLGFTELATSLNHAGFTVPDDISHAETVADVARLLKGSAAPAIQTKTEAAPEESSEIHVPAAVATLGRSLLAAGQKLLYEQLFSTEVMGRAYIPQNQTFLVAANHASHLDMGLLKVAMGEQGELLRALAARDYFFDTPEKRAYFENFTQLLPMDRHGSLKASLRLAGQALGNGSHLLIFPEGTRSEDGALGEFKPTLGFLALTHGVGILPVALIGTHEALPKGAILPRQRSLKVVFGPFLPIGFLRPLAQGLPKSEGYRVVTQTAESAVRALLDGKVLRPTTGPSAAIPVEESAGKSESTNRESAQLKLLPKLTGEPK